MNKVYVIIRCYNEESSILSVAEGALSALPRATVIVVDDGSTDRSLDMARKSRARVLALPQNVGMGAATQAGYQLAFNEGATVAVQMDGDGQHLAEFLPDLVAPVIEGRADLVVGSRYQSFVRVGGASRSSPGRALASLLLSVWYWLLSGKVVHDPTSGFRAVGPELLARFAQSYPQDDAEPRMIFWAIHQKFRVIEVAVEMAQRVHGRSSIGALRGCVCVGKILWLTLLDRVSSGKTRQSSSVFTI